ncbi:uncharacterized protein LOC142177399 [Nicotiana tabacum]|uniref:Uncharacterized protein LOC142177399 n=1 Tax=Nicotiana tabacum TaxID=4097 RepID=A0AC58TXX4_TOBAC
MSSVSKELITEILYARDARKVWEDLKERFDKVNTSRVYQLQKTIATITQGTHSVSVYFSKLKYLWDEFDSIVPPPCDCAISMNFIEFMQKQKVLKFLMGLNDNYEQARSQILMTSPTPSFNKAYAMLVERESERSVANTSTVGEGIDLAALLAGKGGNYQNYQKPKRNWNVQCDFCHMKGHTKEGCYKIIGYPQDFKNKKKGNTNTAYNVQVENLNPNFAGADDRRREIPEAIKEGN